MSVSSAVPFERPVQKCPASPWKVQSYCSVEAKQRDTNCFIVNQLIIIGDRIDISEGWGFYFEPQPLPRTSQLTTATVAILLLIADELPATNDGQCWRDITNHMYDRVECVS